MKRKLTVVPVIVIAVLLMLSTAVFALTGSTTTDSAPLVQVGTTNVEVRTEDLYYMFTPAETGTYRFYSTNRNVDPVAHIYDSGHAEIAYDDDSGESLNFSIDVNMTAGENYYLKLYDWARYNYGTVDLVISSIIINSHNINVTGASGNIGIFVNGDTVTATWNNSETGDNNNGITSVDFDFSQFGASELIPGTETNGLWTASYTIDNSSLEQNAGVSVTAHKPSESSTSTGNTYRVDTRNPDFVFGDDSGKFTYPGDTVTFTATTDEFCYDMNISIPGSVTEVPMTKISPVIWTYSWIVDVDTTPEYISITVSDSAGNSTTKTGSMGAEIDITPPSVTGVENGCTYACSQVIGFTEGTATLNGNIIFTGHRVNKPGEYKLVVTDEAGNSQYVSFTIVPDIAVAKENGFTRQIFTTFRTEDRSGTVVTISPDSQTFARYIGTFLTGEINVYADTLGYKNDDVKYCINLGIEDIRMMQENSCSFKFNISPYTFTLDPAMFDIQDILDYFPEENENTVMIQVMVEKAAAASENRIKAVVTRDGLTAVSDAVRVQLRYVGDMKTVSPGPQNGFITVQTPVAEIAADAEVFSARIMPDMTLDMTVTEANGSCAMVKAYSEGIYILVTE